jgi:two-component sensor histidine kinase
MDAILTSPRVDLVSEANHRVANSLSLLSGLVRMQAKAVGRVDKPFSNAEIRMMFDGVAARIATLGQLHRMLAHLPLDGVVDLNGHLRDLGNILVAAFSSEQQSVHIEHHGAECHVLTRNVQPLTLILCELLTNSMKYAHPSGIPVYITLRCEALADGNLMVSVSDDGVGLPEGFDAGTDGGIGFQIIRTLIAEMGARLEISSDSLGATFRLTVPQTLVANAQTA